LICFVDLTIAGLGIASEIGCFDIDRVNGLLVGSTRVGTATAVLESVTATVIAIDLYVYWKPGFRIKLEALLSSGVSAVGLELKCNNSTAWLQLESTVGGLELDWTRDDIRFGVNDSITRQWQQMSSSLSRVRESIFKDSIAGQWRQQTVAV